MVELPPEEERYYSTASMAVLFDMAAEITTQLGGKYIALARAAQNEDEREQWRQRRYEVEDTHAALDPDDRQAIIDHIVLWRSELAQLRGRRG